ncbi:MAG: aspartate--tRNA ligase [Alphaproteobacteria bacterium]|nr:MAG: aspartate--tRNA ligase [Alphaproteobacteria bacterium]
MHAYRTHTCGELRDSHVGDEVRLSGWIHRKRDHGGLLFIDLRDHYGLTQCVIEPESPFFKQVEAIRQESVIRVTGPVVARSDDTINANLPTGRVEVRIKDLTELSAADELPLPIFGEPHYPEDIRLRHRFLDLRRETLHNNIMLRTNIVRAIRNAMESRGFFEFQTPILTASSPEGARDFLVPSRLHPGKFYALPQAPQQFKQLIMVSGFDRYYQIAPCFRDEDARADRSAGEFYQLDVEMSFVTEADVLETISSVTAEVFTQFADGREVTAHPFPEITFHDAMLKYGTDKPDLRIPIEIVDVTSHFAEQDVTFNAFKKQIKMGGVVRGIPAPGAAAKPRSFFDKLNDWARKDMAAPGLGYIIFDEEAGNLIGKGPIAKFIPDGVLRAMAATAHVGAGDALFFACDKESAAAALAGAARSRIGGELGIAEKDVFRFCWITDYPLFEYNETEKRIDFSHNPFSMPAGGMSDLKDKDPLDIIGLQYDLVCNGHELGSGAIRNHEPEIMFSVFEIAGYSRERVAREFSGLLNAFRFGAPPHGGVALGLDRMVMLLADQVNIREVTMFPMNQQAEDLLMGAPAEASAQQLREAHIRVMLPPETKKQD